MAAKGKYEDFIPVILKMKSEGKTYAEMADFLNKDFDIGADKSSLRDFWRRKIATQNKQDSANNIEEIFQEQTAPKTAPELPGLELKPEKLSAEKIEKLIENEVQMRMTVKEFIIIKEKHQEALEDFSAMSKTFCKLTEKLKSQTSRKPLYFLIAGCWIITIVLALFVGYYICREYPTTAFQTVAILLAIPAGMVIGFSAGIIIKTKKGKKTK